MYSQFLLRLAPPDFRRTADCGELHEPVQNKLIYRKYFFQYHTKFDKSGSPTITFHRMGEGKPRNGTMT